MKRMKWIILALGLCTGFSCFAFDEGTDRGNGGDEYGKAFINLGLDVAEALAQNPLPGVDTKALQAAVDSTFVNSEQTLTLRGAEVDAINYPDSARPRIIVSRQSWDRMAASPHRRAFLVLHEYLGILGVDDSRYQVSILLDRAGVCGRTPQIREAIEGALKKSCYRIIQDDLQWVTGITVFNQGQFEVKADDLAGLKRLEILYLMHNDVTYIDPRAFSQTPKLRQMYLSDSTSQLHDCRFLRAIPNLSILTLTAYSSELRNEPRYLEALEPRCFSGLGKLQSLELAFDAREVQNADWLQGIQGDAHASIYFFVKNINSINTKALLPVNGMPEKITFFSPGLESIDIKTSLAISAVLSKYRCETTAWTSPPGPQAEIICTRN